MNDPALESDYVKSRSDAADQLEVQQALDFAGLNPTSPAAVASNSGNPGAVAPNKPQPTPELVQDGPINVPQSKLQPRRKTDDALGRKQPPEKSSTAATIAKNVAEVPGGII